MPSPWPASSRHERSQSPYPALADRQQTAEPRVGGVAARFVKNRTLGEKPDEIRAFRSDPPHGAGARGFP
jgi:hypothetical protein